MWNIKLEKLLISCKLDICNKYWLTGDDKNIIWDRVEPSSLIIDITATHHGSSYILLWVPPLQFDVLLVLGKRGFSTARYDFLWLWDWAVATVATTPEIFSEFIHPSPGRCHHILFTGLTMPSSYELWLELNTEYKYIHQRLVLRHFQFISGEWCYTWYINGMKYFGIYLWNSVLMLQGALK